MDNECDNFYSLCSVEKSLIFTYTFFCSATKRIKSGKVVGTDDRSMKMSRRKGSGPDCWEGVWGLEKGTGTNFLEQWECSNYRGTQLMRHTMEILERVVEARLRNEVSSSVFPCWESVSEAQLQEKKERLQDTSDICYYVCMVWRSCCSQAQSKKSGSNIKHRWK